MSCCCPGSCPCPDGRPTKCQTGGYWRKGKCGVGPTAVEEPCCFCDVEFTKDQPHEAWAPFSESCGRFEDKCDRECDPEQAGEIGEWIYTYAPLYVTDPDGNLVPVPGSEDTSKPTSRTWNGECPDGVKNSPALPDLIECKCECRYDYYENLCVEENNEDWGSDPDPDICACKCLLTDADCLARDPATPTADTEDGNCECICDVTPDDCGSDVPDFDSDKCECYCAKIDENGDHNCSGDTPDFDSANCECYCAITSCPEGEKLEGCECVPCPNSCNGCESQDPECNCTGCSDCDATAYDYDDGSGESTTVCCPPNTILCQQDGTCVSDDCAVGQSWNSSICECDCDNNKEKCNDTCYDPCEPGETRDEDCKCYDGSSQSLLESLDLLP
jgi:hypothetical protein